MARLFFTACAGHGSRPSVTHGLRRASDDAFRVYAHAVRLPAFRSTQCATGVALEYPLGRASDDAFIYAHAGYIFEKIGVFVGKFGD